MSPPSLAESIAAVLAGKALILKLLEGLEAISPEFLKADEAKIIAAIQAIEIPDVVMLASSLDAAKQVVVTGHGISGGGADASLA